MTEEERAIGRLKNILGWWDCNKIQAYDIETILYLIEKLKKENEEKNCKILNLAEENTRLHKEINERVKLKIENEKIVDEEFIYKDKIRELFEEYNIEFAEDTIAMSEQGAFGFMLSIKELLEEEE